MRDAAFPASAFSDIGYESAHFGNGQWNGVAIVSKVGISDITTGFGDDAANSYPDDARLISAKCGGARVASVYVPNGREVGTEFYARKLIWMDQLGDWLSTKHRSDEPLALCGDFNVAPEDHDVWDPAAFEGATHVTPAERDALARWRNWGLTDSTRATHDESGLYSFWDYRNGDFHMGRGMRIDMIYVTSALADRILSSRIDRDARKGVKPSDHAPVLVEIGQSTRFER